MCMRGTIVVCYIGVLYGVFKVFVVWLSLKTLRSKALASFADHYYLPCSCYELLMDKRDSNSFLLKQRVYTVSNRSYDTTDSSLITAH